MYQETHGRVPAENRSSAWSTTTASVVFSPISASWASDQTAGVVELEAASGVCGAIEAGEVTIRSPSARVSAISPKFGRSHRATAVRATDQVTAYGLPST